MVVEYHIGVGMQLTTNMAAVVALDVISAFISKIRNQSVVTEDDRFNLGQKVFAGRFKATIQLLVDEARHEMSSIGWTWIAVAT